MNRGELISELATSLGLEHEARFIVDEVLGSGPTHSGQIVGPDELNSVRALAARRRAGEPLQYVFGHWSFRRLDLLVDPRVLIPRPETEQVVDVALGEARRIGGARPIIVDAGTGSGAIALSMATELADQFSGGRVWATEASADALAVASANFDRIRHGQAGTVLPVTFVQGSWLRPLPPRLQGSVALVVSNPPYVATGEWHDLPAEVRREPKAALVAGDGSDGTPGLRDVEEVVTQAWTWLARPGAVVVELAPQQADAAVRVARSVGFGDVRVERDLAGRSRALVGVAR